MPPLPQRRVAADLPLHVLGRAVDLAEVLLQVHAGRERLARAGQHEHAAVVVGVERLEHLDHLGVERRAHRVALLRAGSARPRRCRRRPRPAPSGAGGAGLSDPLRPGGGLQDAATKTYVWQLEQDYDATGDVAPRPPRDDDFNPEQLMHELEDFLRGAGRRSQVTPPQAARCGDREGPHGQTHCPLARATSTHGTKARHGACFSTQEVAGHAPRGARLSAWLRREGHRGPSGLWPVIDRALPPPRAGGLDLGGSGLVPTSARAHSHMLSTSAGRVVPHACVPRQSWRAGSEELANAIGALSAGGVPGSPGHTALGWSHTCPPHLVGLTRREGSH